MIRITAYRSPRGLCCASIVPFIIVRDSDLIQKMATAWVTWAYAQSGKYVITTFCGPPVE